MGAEHDPNAPWNEKEIDHVVCSNCNGLGVLDPKAILWTEECPECNGEGYVEDK